MYIVVAFSTKTGANQRGQPCPCLDKRVPLISFDVLFWVVELSQSQRSHPFLLALVGEAMHMRLSPSLHTLGACTMGTELDLVPPRRGPYIIQRRKEHLFLFRYG